jgi:lipopolysaccharide transport system permease protein
MSKVESGEWVQISSKTNWFDVKLKEIWNYRDLIVLFVRRDIVSTYKQTILGPIWFLIGPLFTVVTYTFVFSDIAKIPTDNIPAPLFYLAGTTLWNYFQTCLNGISNTFNQNASIFGKVYFPRLVSPISLMISNLFKLGIQLIMFFAFVVFYSYQDVISPNNYIILLPLIILIIGGIAFGAGIIISSLSTKYRDFTYLLSFGITLLMYITPVIYPISSLPENIKFLLEINPLTPLIEIFRFSFTGRGVIEISGLFYSFCFMIILIVIGVILFNKIEKKFMDTV